MNWRKQRSAEEGQPVKREEAAARWLVDRRGWKQKRSSKAGIDRNSKNGL